MSTFNRVSAFGFGVGLVLAGCASPTDETADDTADQTASPVIEESAAKDETADVVPEESAAVTEQAVALHKKELAAALPMPIAGEPAPPPNPDEANVDSRSDAIIIGGWGGWGVPVGGFGWGGFAPGFGRVMPGVGWGGFGPGFGVMPGVGWGGAWGGGWGLNRGFWW